uniref:Serpentine receptor class gamma n=1 Tax=Caenorhabditis tropicalis TaxID=1561998 RepID=A0A1I7U9N6_9PELO
MDTIMKIWLFYGILSAILMVTLLILLNTNKLFVHSFYRIISMDILLNLLCWINTWPNRIVYRMDTADFVLFIYENAHFLLDFSTILGVAFFHIQSLSAIMICVHRLTTACFENANRFWSRWYILIYTLIVIFSCTASALMKFPSALYDYETGAFVEGVLPHETGILYGMIILAFTFLYFFTIVIVGVVTIYQVRKRLGQHAEQQKELLRRMSKIAIVNNCVYMTFSISYIMLFLDSNVRMVLKDSVVPRTFSRIYNVRVSNSNAMQNTS